jgi:hypothetical protein
MVLSKIKNHNLTAKQCRAEENAMANLRVDSITETHSLA